MFCPKCKIEMNIKATRYVVENDNTDAETTKLFLEHDLSCRNKICPKYGTVVETVRTELPISTR